MKRGVLASLNQQVTVEQATQVAQGRGYAVMNQRGAATALTWCCGF